MSKKVNILCVLNILVVAVISIYTKQQNSITNSIGNGYIIIGFVILAVYLLLIIALLRAINISRDDLKRSLIVLFFVAGAIFLFVGFFIFFVGDLCLLINYKYHMGEGSWLSYFGSVFGAGITVIGAYIVTSLQSNNDNKKLIKAKCILFLNDLKYINDRVDEYVNELERKKDNQEFYRIRYLNISENWREQVSFLFQNRILENFDVNTFYDYFTDIYFIKINMKKFMS